MGMPDYTEAIVGCPRCGRRNRVFRVHRDKGFRCGHCQTDLANPFPARNKLVALALDQPWRAGAILIVIGLSLLGGWTAFAMKSLQTLEATLARQRADATNAHPARLQTNAVLHAAALRTEAARQKETAEQELARHRVQLGETAVLSGEAAQRKHEDEWRRRQAYAPEFAVSPVEKVMLEMHQTAGNRELPFQKIIERVALLASPRGSRVEVTSRDGPLFVRVAFRMSAFNSQEAGAVTAHTSTRTLRTEAIDLCARVMRDIYEHCGTRGIDGVQLSCNHAVRESAVSPVASKSEKMSKLATAPVVWSVLYRCRLTKRAADTVANWHAAPIERIKSLLVVEEDKFDALILSGQASGGSEGDPGSPPKFD